MSRLPTPPDPPVRPILKWAGGKSRLASRISEAFRGPCRGTYFEPFLGSGAVFLYRRRHGSVGRAVLSDVNAKLVALYAAVRDDPDAVIQAIGRLPRSDWRERYYEVREAYNQGPMAGPDHAARFVWLNRAGYNGLYRENRRGQLNVPVGSYAHLAIPEPTVFWEAALALRGVELRAGSFATVLEEVRPGDQVYCDPPYVPLSNTACFVGYAAEPFGPPEQRALATTAEACASRGAVVVLSNHDLPVVREELYPTRRGFELVSLQVSRAISRDGAGRHTVAEVLAAIGPRPQAA